MQNMQILMHKYFLGLSVFFFIAVLTNAVYGQKKDTLNISFESQNKKANYKSISAGMGISYTNNTELINFAGYEIPNYYSLSRTQQFSDYSTGLEFFVAAEYQIWKNFSAEIEYNYFSKKLSIESYPQYDFSYVDNKIFLNVYYLIPDKNAFLKIGVGTGMLFSDFTYLYYGAESKYTSTGFGLKLNAVLNLQLSKNFASYFGVYGISTFNNALKGSNGMTLKNRSGNEVNLNSIGVGLKLGFQFILF